MGDVPPEGRAPAGPSGGGGNLWGVVKASRVDMLMNMLREKDAKIAALQREMRDAIAARDAGHRAVQTEMLHQKQQAGLCRAEREEARNEARVLRERVRFYEKQPQQQPPSTGGGDKKSGAGKVPASPRSSAAAGGGVGDVESEVSQLQASKHLLLVRLSKLEDKYYELRGRYRGFFAHLSTRVKVVQEAAGEIRRCVAREVAAVAHWLSVQSRLAFQKCQLVHATDWSIPHDTRVLNAHVSRLVSQLNDLLRSHRGETAASAAEGAIALPDICPDSGGGGGGGGGRGGGGGEFVLVAHADGEDRVRLDGFHACLATIGEVTARCALLERGLHSKRAFQALQEKEAERRLLRELLESEAAILHTWFADAGLHAPPPPPQQPPQLTATLRAASAAFLRACGDAVPAERGQVRRLAAAAAEIPTDICEANLRLAWLRASYDAHRHRCAPVRGSPGQRPLLACCARNRAAWRKEGAAQAARELRALGRTGCASPALSPSPSPSPSPPPQQWDAAAATAAVAVSPSTAAVAQKPPPTQHRLAGIVKRRFRQGGVTLPPANADEEAAAAAASGRAAKAPAGARRGSLRGGGCVDRAVGTQTLPEDRCRECRGRLSCTECAHAELLDATYPVDVLETLSAVKQEIAAEERKRLSAQRRRNAALREMMGLLRYSGRVLREPPARQLAAVAARIAAVQAGGRSLQPAGSLSARGGGGGGGGGAGVPLGDPHVHIPTAAGLAAEGREAEAEAEAAAATDVSPSSPSPPPPPPCAASPAAARPTLELRGLRAAGAADERVTPAACLVLKRPTVLAFLEQQYVRERHALERARGGGTAPPLPDGLPIAAGDGGSAGDVRDWRELIAATRADCVAAEAGQRRRSPPQRKRRRRRPPPPPQRPEPRATARAAAGKEAAAPLTPPPSPPQLPPRSAGRAPLPLPAEHYYVSGEEIARRKDAALGLGQRRRRAEGRRARACHKSLTPTETLPSWEGGGGGSVQAAIPQEIVDVTLDTLPLTTLLWSGHGFPSACGGAGPPAPPSAKRRSPLAPPPKLPCIS